jgi:hypothetical protein
VKVELFTSITTYPKNFDTMSNHHLSQKLKLIVRGKFNYLINTLTLASTITFLCNWQSNKEGEKRHEISRQIRQGALVQSNHITLGQVKPLPTSKMMLYHLNNVCHPKIDLALLKAPNKRARYFLGKEETMHPKIQARLSTL